MVLKTKVIKSSLRCFDCDTSIVVGKVVNIGPRRRVLLCIKHAEIRLGIRNANGRKVT